VRTIVIGIGNPVLHDDSVGLKVAGLLREELRDSRHVAVTELHAGGIRLMEAMAGYDRAILVDAIQTEGGKPGSIYALEPADLARTRNIHSTHDGSLAVALELGRVAGIRLPSEIRIWAVEAGDVESFSESLTEEVARAVPRVVESVIGHLEAEGLSGQEGNS
jgi:hydrogenase maturation protease